MERLFGKTFNLLGAMMDYRSERNKVITSNIANIDTPDYRPFDYVFKQELKKNPVGRIPLARTDEKHFPNAADEISRNDFTRVVSGDKVDLDGEMTHLAENHLMFNLTAELLARKFKGIRNVLTEAK